jgi:hypothetical protein
MLNQALQEQNMQGIDLIDSSMSFEEKANGVGPDAADAATLQPALKKSQTYMNNPALMHTFSQNYGAPEMQMKKATSVQIVRPQLSTLEATHCSADGSSINQDMYTVND